MLCVERDEIVCGSRLLIDGNCNALVEHFDEDVVGSRCRNGQCSEDEQRPQTDEWVHLPRGARQGKRHSPFANLNDTPLQTVEPPQRARWPADPVRVPAAPSPRTSSIGSFPAVVGERPDIHVGSARIAAAEHTLRIGSRGLLGQATGFLHSTEAPLAGDEGDQCDKSHRARQEDRG